VRAEVVNMLPPDRLVKGGVCCCPASATAGRAAPRPARRSSTPRPRRRSAAGWRCSDRRQGPVDIGKRTANILISDEELAKRRRLEAARQGSQTPWQELQRKFVGQLASGACLDFAVN
jgi:dihydroxy-acid dehydratase